MVFQESLTDPKTNGTILKNYPNGIESTIIKNSWQEKVVHYVIDVYNERQSQKILNGTTNVSNPGPKWPWY